MLNVRLQNLFLHIVHWRIYWGRGKLPHRDPCELQWLPLVRNRKYFCIKINCYDTRHPESLIQFYVVKKQEEQLPPPAGTARVCQIDQSCLINTDLDLSSQFRASSRLVTVCRLEDFTARHLMQHTVLLSQFCSSVRLSVCQMRVL